MPSDALALEIPLATQIPTGARMGALQHDDFHLGICFSGATNVQRPCLMNSLTRNLKLKHSRLPTFEKKLEDSCSSDFPASMGKHAQAS